MMFYGFGLIGIGIIAISSMIHGTIFFTQEKLDQPYITFGEFLIYMIPLIIVGILLSFPLFILDYFNIKNRRNFNDQ